LYWGSVSTSSRVIIGCSVQCLGGLLTRYRGFSDHNLSKLKPCLKQTWSNHSSVLLTASFHDLFTRHSFSINSRRPLASVSSGADNGRYFLIREPLHHISFSGFHWLAVVAALYYAATLLAWDWSWRTSKGAKIWHDVILLSTTLPGTTCSLRAFPLTMTSKSLHPVAVHAAINARVSN
jgi:hypothetical protein